MLKDRPEQHLLSDEATAIARMYASWAPTYNRMVEGEDIDKYTAADKVAEAACARASASNVSSILDLATGTGAVVGKLRSTFKTASALGLDISEPMMDKARFSGIGLKTTLCDIERMRWPVPDKSIDLITCAGALSMVGDIRHILSETDRTLKSGGVAVMSFLISSLRSKGSITPNYGFRTYMRSINEMEDIVREAGFQPQHSESFTGFAGPQFRETHGLITFTR